MISTLAGLANLLRMHTAGFEGLVFTIGPLLTNRSATAGDLVCLWWIGVVVNGYIFALNDLVDLPHDRRNPARTRSPLVTGGISERTALSAAIVLPLAAIGTAVAAGWQRAAAVLFVALLAMAAVVNVYQKVTRHPVLMDLAYATTMAAPLPITAQAYEHEVTPLVWCATSSLFFLALQLNSVAGNLKDLASDRSTGFRTVAIVLGAAVESDGKLVAGHRYRAYCWTVHALAGFTATVTVGAAVTQHRGWIVVAVGVAATAALAFGTRDLWRLLSGARQPARNGREWYFACGFALLLMAVGLSAPQKTFWAVITALAAWEIAFRLYRYWMRSRGAIPAIVRGR
ncbi:UbiA family prenyltransferase [Streptomyces sp. NPDC002926]